MPIPALSWPRTQRFDELDAKTRGTVHAAVAQQVAQMRIPVDMTPLVDALYVPMAAWLQAWRSAKSGPLIVGLTGGQGSGKSTISALLRTVLEHGFGLRAATLSIDDIYSTRAERARLGREIHPLLATRGPPATHDTGLGLRTLEALTSLRAGEVFAVPSFDKAVDDRRPETEWPTVSGPVDVVLFEGWCVGASAEPDAALLEPLNSLERTQDPQGRWRAHVNAALADDYRALFNLVDVQVFLRISSMERVFEWRELQEAKLRKSVGASSNADSELRVMDSQTVVRFVQHYERITRHLLRELPERAHLIVDINDAHQPSAVTINKPVATL
jgi:D-glycerate 3-kinase